MLSALQRHYSTRITQGRMNPPTAGCWYGSSLLMPHSLLEVETGCTTRSSWEPDSCYFELPSKLLPSLPLILAFLLMDGVQDSTVTVPTVMCWVPLCSLGSTQHSRIQGSPPKSTSRSDNHFFQWGRVRRAPPWAPDHPMGGLIRGGWPHPVSCRSTRRLPEDRGGPQQTWKPEKAFRDT